MTSHMSSCATVSMCCLALLAFCGCGNGGGKTEIDMAALNAALAVREGALLERFGGLAPVEVEQARSYVVESVSSGEITIARLPAEDCDAVLAQATALAQFRNGCEPLVAEAAAAVGAVAEARRVYGKELATLKKAAADLSRKDVAAFIDGFASDLREKETLLSGWRRQRLEKIEDKESATFPAFAAAEEEHCAAWEEWSAMAAEMQRPILEDIFPQACAAVSNMNARAIEAEREHGRMADAMSRLRAIPVDMTLVAAARRQSLEVFDGLVLETMDAICKWDGDENNFISSSRKRAEECGKRAEALETDSSAFAGAHPDFLPKQSRKDAQTVAAATKAQTETILGDVKDFNDGVIRLKEEGEKLSKAMESARKAADTIRKMTQVEEETLANGIADIEALRLKVEKSDAISIRKAIDAKRNAAQTMLQKAESTLATGEQNFAGAKVKALADERAAKWEAEKRSMRNSLTKIKENLETSPKPGYKRPERDANALRDNIGRLLGKIDSMGEAELRAAVKKAQDDLNIIEAKTKWTMGTRHPDRPHIFASTENGKDVWECDPGYVWVEPGSYNLDCYWSPGRSHPNHPHVSAGQTEGTWVPDPGYKARWNGDMDPVWTKGMRHPTKPHIFATEKEHMWDADPGYWFDHPSETNCDLVVSWRPKRSHPDHPHISAGQTEGTWVPDPGYKARWGGDLDPVWTPGMRHPTWPHVVASGKEKVWDSDPGYEWASSEKADFSVRWKPGLRHPDHEGIESAQQEGKWSLLPGWAWVNPGTSDLRTRWVSGARYPGKPHIHASDNKWKWSADDGYDFDDYNSSNLSVHWESGSWHSRYSGVIASRQEGYWETAAGWKFVVLGPSVRNESSDLRAQWVPGKWHPTQPHVFSSQNENRWSCEEGYTFVNPSGSDLSVRWTPGWVSPDGQKRAKQQEGRFEQKRDCSSCENGYKIHWKRCEICNGSGRFLFGDCPRCEGIGKIQNKTFCTNCNGVGWKWR